MLPSSVVFCGMDIVVSTLHGDADVSIVAHGPGATLADLLTVVTGQAVPRLAAVDGHPVTCSTPLDQAGLVMGSVVTTEPPAPLPRERDEVELIQLTGVGAGRAVRLGAGRYRIGPGRRLSADELAQAPVEAPAFELGIGAVESEVPAQVDDRRVPDVEVTPTGGHTLLLDATSVDSPSQWTDEYLTSANRMFLIDRASPQERATRSLVANAAGFASFHRPPPLRPRTQRRPAIDALNDAHLAAPDLWLRRAGRPGAFELAIGLRPTIDRPETVTLDLAESPIVAVTGSERFRLALARTIVVEAATLHGPVDLDLAIVSQHDQIAAWEWAKWLPHVRPDGDPAISTDPRDVSDRVTRIGERRWGAGHLTLLIVDDPMQWTRPGASLQALIADPPDGVRIVALCDTPLDAPSGSCVIVKESSDGHAQLDVLGSGLEPVVFLPSLLETDVALGVARSLAPLVDAAFPAVGSRLDRLDDHDIVRMLGLESATGQELRDRWESSSSVRQGAVAVGLRDDEVVTIDLDATGDLVVTGTTIDEAVDLAAAIACGLAANHPPSELWIGALTAEVFPQLATIARLPHAARPVGPIVDVGRLIGRIEAVLERRVGPSRILVVVPVTSGLGTPLLDTDAVVTLLEASQRLRGVRVIVATDPLDPMVHDAFESFAATTVRIRPSVPGPRATMTTSIAAGVEPMVAFSPYGRGRAMTTDVLDLRPAVVGRRFTPLERRLARAARRDPTETDAGMDAVVQLLCDAAVGMTADRPVLAPDPLARSVDVAELFRSHPGDGVPIGLIDDVGDARTRPLWWEPGGGSLMLFGSRRSGVDAVLTTVVAGVTERFATADVSIVMIESSAKRRSAMRSVDHVRLVAAPDDPGEMSALLDEIAAALRPVENAGPIDPAVLLVVIGDLAKVRRGLAHLEARFDELLAAARPGSGVDVIVYAGDRSTVGPLWHPDVSYLVGSSSDVVELSELGVTDPAALDGVGRCRRFPGGELVQLASDTNPPEPGPPDAGPPDVDGPGAAS